MRLKSLIALLLLCSGCLTIFGVHRGRARDASSKFFGACDDVAIVEDEIDGWIWHTRGCRKDAWCWYGASLHNMTCADESPKVRFEQQARAALRCPQGALVRVSAPDWNTEVVACDRITWCKNEDFERVTCVPPDDLQLVLKQASVESGCPSESIEQLQFFRLDTQTTYRLNACGNQFSCIVPLVSDKGGRDVAGSRFGSQLTCKAIPAIAAPLTPPN